MVHTTIDDPTAATTQYEDHKRQHNNTELDCQAAGISFIPMVMEADGGAWGPAAVAVLSELAKVKACIAGEIRNSTQSQIFQNLGILLHTENARAILRRSTTTANHLTLLRAAATLQSPAS